LASIGQLVLRLFKQPWRLAVLLGAAILMSWLKPHLPSNGIAGILWQVAVTTGTLLTVGPFVVLPPISDKRQAPASRPRQQS
jgi:hypothetical protein